MAQSRILNYDGEYITFWYDRHEYNQRVEETIHAYDFIKRLIIHIYDKYFNVVRYYGLYAKKHKFSDKFFYMLKPHVSKFRKQLKNWRCRIKLYFKHAHLFALVDTLFTLTISFKNRIILHEVISLKIKTPTYTEFICTRCKYH